MGEVVGLPTCVWCRITVTSSPERKSPTAEPTAQPPGRSGRHRPLPGWLLAVLAAVTIVLVVLLAPRLLYPPLSDRELDRQGVTDGKERIELKREQGKLQNDARATLLQGVAGGVLLLGAYFTWRQMQITRQQLHVAEQGQLTERFTRAIDQLGDNQGQLDVVLGGIYALERIARDSPEDRATIAEVLTAYVRGHAPRPPTRRGQPAADTATEELPLLQTWAPDVQAAVTVLGRGQFPSPYPNSEVARLDLADTDLRRGYFRDVDLRGSRLVGVDLQRAWIYGADLRGANLERADLRGAYLDHADLRGAHLENAYADSWTRWPEGWDRQRAENAGVLFQDPTDSPLSKRKLST